MLWTPAMSSSPSAPRIIFSHLKSLIIRRRGPNIAKHLPPLPRVVTETHKHNTSVNVFPGTRAPPGTLAYVCGEERLLSHETRAKEHACWKQLTLDEKRELAIYKHEHIPSDFEKLLNRERTRIRSALPELRQQGLVICVLLVLSFFYNVYIAYYHLTSRANWDFLINMLKYYVPKEAVGPHECAVPPEWREAFEDYYILLRAGYTVVDGKVVKIKDVEAMQRTNTDTITPADMNRGIGNGRTASLWLVMCMKNDFTLYVDLLFNLAIDFIP